MLFVPREMRLGSSLGELNAGASRIDGLEPGDLKAEFKGLACTVYVRGGRHDAGLKVYLCGFVAAGVSFLATRALPGLALRLVDAIL